MPPASVSLLCCRLTGCGARVSWGCDTVPLNFVAPTGDSLGAAVLQGHAEGKEQVREKGITDTRRLCTNNRAEKGVSCNRLDGKLSEGSRNGGEEPHRETWAQILS